MPTLGEGVICFTILAAPYTRRGVRASGSIPPRHGEGA